MVHLIIPLEDFRFRGIILSAFVLQLTPRFTTKSDKIGILLVLMLSSVSAQIRPDSSAYREPKELTREVYDRLNNLPPPQPTGYFVMDGTLDSSAVLLSSSGKVNLYAAVRGSQLYVATEAARTQLADVFLFLVFAPASLRNAASAKGGQVAAWAAFLWNRKSDNASGWSDASESLLTSITVDTTGAVLEGVVDFELLTGVSSGEVYLAVGTYKEGDGGKLIGQSPRGNGDGIIDPEEFYQLGTGLPFNLDRFSATSSPDKHVRLNWRTLHEANNRGFEIQRKRYGETTFQTLRHSFVPGHGTTKEPATYSFTDVHTAVGNWRYRLRQIDLDGTTHYSPERSVKIPNQVNRTKR